MASRGPGVWTEADQAEFEARLARAQASRQAQQLCLRGEALLAEGEAAAALQMFALAEAAWPQAALAPAALTGQGRALEALGQTGSALAAYSRAVSQIRNHRIVDTEAWLLLAELVAREDVADRRDEALSGLREFGKDAQGEAAARVAAARAALTRRSAEKPL